MYGLVSLCYLVASVCNLTAGIVIFNYEVPYHFYKTFRSVSIGDPANSSADVTRTLHYLFIQNVPRGNVNILGGHSIGHSEQESVYVHVSYSERFPR
jgi:hypothetical protein